MGERRNASGCRGFFYLPPLAQASKLRAGDSSIQVAVSGTRNTGPPSVAGSKVKDVGQSWRNQRLITYDRERARMVGVWELASWRINAAVSIEPVELLGFGIINRAGQPSYGRSFQKNPREHLFEFKSNKKS